MKIGRNESCPCGSGKKYKKCCLDKSDEQRLAEAVLRSSENLKNEAHIKQCLHPNKDECDEKIIKAHAIQNNRILNKISENGVILTDGVYQEFEIAKKSNAYIIPIGSTGYVAKQIWNEVSENIEEYPYLKSEEVILRESVDPEEVIRAILQILLRIQKEY